ncbi:MAG: porin family protein [Ginsengibacter sp.]
MKAKLMLMAAMLLICSISFSQGLNFGIKGGASINKIDGRSFKDEFTYGYHLGAFAIISLGKKFAIQPEVLFNQIKTDTSSSFSSLYQFNKISDIKLNYLSIPILLNYNVSNILALQAGPQFGILIDQNKKLVQNGKDAFKSGDFSMLGGLQLKFLKFRVYGRYAIGLYDINAITNSDKWKSQSVQLGVGISL